MSNGELSGGSGGGASWLATIPETTDRAIGSRRANQRAANQSGERSTAQLAVRVARSATRTIEITRRDYHAGVKSNRPIPGRVNCLVVQVFIFHFPSILLDSFPQAASQTKPAFLLNNPSTCDERKLPLLWPCAFVLRHCSPYILLSAPA